MSSLVFKTKGDISTYTCDTSNKNTIDFSDPQRKSPDKLSSKKGNQEADGFHLSSFFFFFGGGGGVR